MAITLQKGQKVDLTKGRSLTGCWLAWLDTTNTMARILT